MLLYAIKQMNSYINDSDIKDEILYQYPVPDNLNNKKDMDSNINSLLTEMRAKETLSLDKAFGSVQDKVLNIFGPLSQVWEFLEIQKDHAIEQTSNMPEEEFTQEVVDMLRSAKDCARLMDMTVTMLGQAFNTISYYRRRNALSSILKGDKTKVKNMMKENKEILQEDTSNRLFGEKFDEKMVEFVKLKKKSKEFLLSWTTKQNRPSINKPELDSTSPFVGAPYPVQVEGGRIISKATNPKVEATELVSLTSSSLQTNLVPILSVQDYPKVHRLVKNLFPVKLSQSLPLAGRVKFFIKNWEKLRGKDPSVLEIVQGYKIPFTDTPHQTFLPKAGNLSKEEKKLVDQEIEQMQLKGAITKVKPCEDQFLSNIFTVPKKDGGNRPVINLKYLNSFIHCPHFKMEGLFLVKELLSPNDWMCKVDLKDAYFSIPIHQNSQKFLRFEWEGSLYQFLSLCFGLSPAPLVFTKLLKVPITLLRKLQIRLIIYLDDILLMASSKEELEIARDTLIFLFQHLGFVINVKKSELTPSKRMEFLGVIIDSVNMEMSLSEEKVQKIIVKCLKMLEKKKVSIREVSQLIGTLTSTTMAILPAPYQYRFLQKQVIQELNFYLSYEKQIVLFPQGRAEIEWWINNIRLNNGRSLLWKPPSY